MDFPKFSRFGRGFPGCFGGFVGGFGGFSAVSCFLVCWFDGFMVHVALQCFYIGFASRLFSSSQSHPKRFCLWRTRSAKGSSVGAEVFEKEARYKAQKIITINCCGSTKATTMNSLLVNGHKKRWLVGRFFLTPISDACMKTASERLDSESLKRFQHPETQPVTLSRTFWLRLM